MTTFLQDLQKEIDNTTIVKPVAEGPYPEGRVMLEVNDDLKRTYSLHAKLAKEASKMKKDHEQKHARFLFGGDGMEKECEKVFRDYRALMDKADILRKVFWSSVHAELGDAEYDDLSLRPDWKIISFESKEEEDPILGGIIVVSSMKM